MIPSLFFNGPGDSIFASTNEFGIPSLLLECQPPRALSLPVCSWGERGRIRQFIQTYFFYNHDVNLDVLVKHPEKIVHSGCAQAGELNLTVNDMMPEAKAIERIYEKRYVSRYLQECGIPVWVDLNVSRRYSDLNLIGVPRGYNAFCTRGYSDRIEDLSFEFQIAQRVSGLDCPNMIVYAGGIKAKRFCEEHNLIYVYDSTTERHKQLRSEGKEGGAND